jgi:carboxylesterase type B
MFRGVSKITTDQRTRANLVVASNANSDSKLPVLLWIYGGGFEFGSTQGQEASKLIQASIAQGKPIVYAQMNYRLHGFGFMPGKEILNSGNGNIGL